jgi:hypothetical protein
MSWIVFLGGEIAKTKLDEMNNKKEIIDMENKGYTAAALVPLHRGKIPTPKPEPDGFQNLVWYDGPLMFAMGDRAEPYLGFEANARHPSKCTYFLVPFTVVGIDAYMAGDLSLGQAIELADGHVYYSEDLVTFERATIHQMPEEDRFQLPLTGKHFEEVMERKPFFHAI